jgi:hypothetical protein
VISEIALPSELSSAAACLEQRLLLLRVPTRKVPMAEWNSTPEAIHRLIPDWIPTLLSQFSLLGTVLECRNNYDSRCWQRQFCFWGPDEFTRNLHGEYQYCFLDEFVEEGLVMISDESDGDMWLTSISGGPSSPILLFDLSGHEKILASSRIALLMASMAISDESYTGESSGKYGTPRSVMWYSD